jgi:hypothetical protein
MKERAEGRRNARLRTEQRIRRERLVLAAGLLAFGQTSDILSAIDTAATVGRIMRDFQLSSAHVGVDRLRAHSEDLADLVHRKPGTHGA